MFIIVCFILGISLPLLWSRYLDFKRDISRNPLPEDSKWVIAITEKKEVVTNPPKSPDNIEVTTNPEQLTDHEVTSLPPMSTEREQVSSKDQLWTKYVHLCIMFNLNRIKPNLQTINLLLEYYHPFFDRITLIFDGKWKKRPEYLPEYVKFFGCESHVGWFQHKCLNMCLSQPADDEVKGFFYIADDMFINLNNLASYNLSQAWCMTTGVYDYDELMIKDKNEIHKIWMWWGPPLFFEKVLKRVVDTLPTEWINQLQANVGFPDNYHGKGIFDIIYLPKSLASNMTRVLTHILSCKEDLFCELAGPLAVGIVVPWDEKIEFTSSFLWGHQRNVDTIRIVAQKKALDVVHAVKLSEPDKAALWKELMDQQLKLAANQTH